ncbi:MAP7 domain-containing protein 3 isoform X2 [Rana temporaria]|uniref:MAP7 domain-containing protein 3 isoform X2 n=1 Tax=Rana temporaria TaxID=8407 RepID=UPI001AAC58C4|nr:MAP7 domain-containing protein 3 isoform X2 [Rana temporaria]
MRSPGRIERAAIPEEGKMADGSGKLKELREQMVAAAQALADERRSQAGSSPNPVQSATSGKATKPVIDGSSLRTDERQRLARERREEKERLNAAKEKELLEKEKKAKLQYEKHMEEKQKKLEEQKLKDEHKRTAAEEKRKQKVHEEKERREATLRRTLERSSQLDQRQKRWSWGGVGDGDKTGAPGNDSPSSVENIIKNTSTAVAQAEDKSGPSANKRSNSASNLKQADSVVSKRLSSSSATLQTSSEKGTKQRSSSLSRLSNKTPLSPQPFLPRVSNQDNKGGAPQKRSSSLSRLNNKKTSLVEGVNKEENSAHRPQTSPLDSSLISRLLAPTQSSLARSKSAATLSADGKDSPASATTINTPPSVSKGPMRSRSIDRLKSPQSATSGASSSESSQKPENEKSSPPAIGKRPPSPNVTLNRRSPSPASTTKRAPSPTLEKKTNSSQAQKNRPPSPSLLKQRPPSPTVVHKPIPIQRPSLTPTVLTATKKNADLEAKPKEKSVDGISSEPKNVQASEKETPVTKTKDESSNKTLSGSTTAEEAAKILAEKRRYAREQRERDEKERIQRQQEEKVRQEEMARKAEEERQRLQEEEKLLEERRKLEREEDERKSQEEKLCRELEEQEKLAELQLQKEEAEARALEEAEKQRQEREKIMQQNMQERLERKKRIEEIMKRTRKTDQADAKNEEDEENFNLDKNSPDSTNDSDSCDDADDLQELQVTPTSSSPDFLSRDAAAEGMNELFVNGDKPDIDQKLNGHFSDTTPTVYSQVANDTVNLSLDQPFPSEDDQRGEPITKINGKPCTWTFEEIIDLEIHSKTSSLSEPNTTDGCNQDFIESATIPPKLAFEEGHVNSLSMTIETAAEM